MMGWNLRWVCTTPKLPLLGDLPPDSRAQSLLPLLPSLPLELISISCVFAGNLHLGLKTECRRQSRPKALLGPPRIVSHGTLLPTVAELKIYGQPEDGGNESIRTERATRRGFGPLQSAVY